MARLLGPDDGSRLVFSISGSALVKASGQTATVYTTSAASVLADVRTYDGTGTPGAAISGSALTVDAYSMLPLFWFPDGVDVVYVVVNGGPATAVYARTDDRIDSLSTSVTALSSTLTTTTATANAALPKAGGTMTGTLTVQTPDDAVAAEVWIKSTFDGGEDEGQVGQYDSTARLNLESYQRADFHSYGEVLRIYSRRADSKQMIAWYGPDDYDNVTREPIGDDRPWFWMGAHYEANDHGSIHGHWSCEIPDTTGALQTRLELPIWDPVTGVYGMDKGTIKTNATDFNVRCSNGQELRLSAPVASDKQIMFSLSSDGEDAHRRWAIRATATDVDLHFRRYDGSGVFADSPLTLTRSTGLISIGGSSGTAGGLAVTRATGVAATVSNTGAGGTCLLASSADTASSALQADVTGDGTKRFVILATGQHEWGPGNAARDVNLYRSSADVLKTDDSLHVGVNIRMNTTSLGSGVGVLAMANATTAPSGTPTGGGVLYPAAGALFWKGSAGTLTELAPA